MVCILEYVQNNNVEQALRSLKRKAQVENLAIEIKLREYFVSPRRRRRLKDMESLQRIKFENKMKRERAKRYYLK